MRTSIQLLLPLLFSISCYAQISEEDSLEIAALKQTIASAKHDSVIINSWKQWDDILYSFNSQSDIGLNLKIDSLCSINLEKNLNETEELFFSRTKGTALMSIGNAYWYNYEDDSARIYYEKSLEITKSTDDKLKMAKLLNNLGNVSDSEDDALDYYNQSLKQYHEIGNEEKVAATLCNIGGIYMDKSEYATAMEYLTGALKIQERYEENAELGNTYNSIGIIYKEIAEDSLAINYFKKSLLFYEERGNLDRTSTALFNIGNVYASGGNYEKAEEYFNQCLEVSKELSQPWSIAFLLNNLGSIHNEQGHHTIALDYYNQSLVMREALGDQRGLCTTLNNMAMVFRKEKQYSEAIKYGEKAFHIAKELDDLELTEFSAKELWLVYRESGRYKESLSMHELYRETLDSIELANNQNEVIRLQYQYDYEKKAYADSIQTAEEAKVQQALLETEKAKTAQQRQRSYFLYIGLALTLLFGGFIFNRFRITRRQKLTIEEQKQEVDSAYMQLEEKNNEVLDSIKYAKRIQSAILVPLSQVNTFFKSSFVLYKPKDIVAGDFYWVERHANRVFFAAADCTGHGVPGAMVSVVCNNALNRSLREYGLTTPGEILDRTREIVIAEFEKSEDEVKDGMDIALCSLNGNTLHYAGANNPLWIIRKGAESIEEIKANKQPIGQFTQPVPYTTHSVELAPGDSVYIFSDGYVDQFGGEKGKKFRPKALRALLLSIQDHNMDEQMSIIDEEFEKWKGNLEQIDDVCMIGVRV